MAKRYFVKAKSRPHYAGFMRSGLYFVSAHETELSEHQITSAILEEPMLIVRVEEDAETEATTHIQADPVPAKSRKRRRGK